MLRKKLTIYSSFIVPYLTIHTQQIYHSYIIQKREMRIVCNAEYSQPTHLFIKLKTFKFRYLVNFITVQLMYEIINLEAPLSVQMLFQWRDSVYTLCETFIFKTPMTRTNTKYRRS